MIAASQTNTQLVNLKKGHVTSDPPQTERDGPCKDSDPGDTHSGEGLATVRSLLARKLADVELLNPGRQSDAITVPASPEPPVPPQPKPSP